MAKYALYRYTTHQNKRMFHSRETFASRKEAEKALRELRQIIKDDFYNGHVTDWSGTNLFSKAVEYRAGSSLRWTAQNMNHLAVIEKISE